MAGPRRYRADGLTEDDVDRWVQSVCVLCSNGCATDIAVKDGRMVGVRGRPMDIVNHGRLGPKGLFGSWQGMDNPVRLTRPLIRENGELVGWERIARGLYLPADSSAADWDQLKASARRPKSTMCLVSALAYYDLTDTIPQALDVAIPRGTRTPASEGAIDWHQFDAETFDLEREDIVIPGSARKIGIYTPERTIVDCFRLRARTGYEIPRDALKEWLRCGGKPAKLMKIARALPRSTKPVLDALEILA